MAADVIWPREELPARRPFFNVARRSVAGPATREGLGQVSASDAGIWKATFEEIIVYQQNGRDRIKLWHAIDGLLDGRLNTVLMPVETTGRRPLPAGVTDEDIDYEETTPHDDDSFFDDDSGYLNSWIGVEVASNAAARATTLSLTKVAAGDLEPGMRFSIGERLYQIKTVVSQTAGAATITINLPLREAVVAGAECNFARPVCLMRLATDEEMDLAIEMARYAFPTINLVEAL